MQIDQYNSGGIKMGLFSLFRKSNFQVEPDIGRSYVVDTNGELLPVYYRDESGTFSSFPRGKETSCFYLEIRRPIIIKGRDSNLPKINSLPKGCDGLIIFHDDPCQSKTYFVLNYKKQVTRVDIGNPLDDISSAQKQLMKTDVGLMFSTITEDLPFYKFAEDYGTQKLLQCEAMIFMYYHFSYYTEMKIFLPDEQIDKYNDQFEKLLTDYYQSVDRAITKKTVESVETTRLVSYAIGFSEYGDKVKNPLMYFTDAIYSIVKNFALLADQITDNRSIDKDPVLSKLIFHSVLNFYEEYFITGALESFWDTLYLNEQEEHQPVKIKENDINDIKNCSVSINRQIHVLMRFIAEAYKSPDLNRFVTYVPEFISILFAIHASEYTDLFAKNNIYDWNEVLRFFIKESGATWDDPLVVNIRKQIDYYYNIIQKDEDISMATLECVNRIHFLMKGKGSALYGEPVSICPVNLDIFSVEGKAEYLVINHLSDFIKDIVTKTN